MDVQTGMLTGIGGLRLCYQGWLPEHTPKARLIICHGLAEHGGRYAHVAEALAARGFAVWAVDHRGHGRSEGLRGYVERFDMYIEDMRTLLDHVAPAPKTFIYGHSMGGVITLPFALRFTGMLDGIVLTGTVLQAGEGISPLLVSSAKLLSVLVPKLPVLTLESAALSHDPAINTTYDADPLVYRGKIRARLGAEILRANAYVIESLDKITSPILIMHGAEDKLASPAGSQMIYKQAGSADKTLKLWEGMYHEIHNEPAVRDDVIAMMGDWMEARL